MYIPDIVHYHELCPKSRNNEDILTDEDINAHRTYMDIIMLQYINSKPVQPTIQ
jgi:hypothetical protein